MGINTQTERQTVDRNTDSRQKDRQQTERQTVDRQTDNQPDTVLCRGAPLLKRNLTEFIIPDTLVTALLISLTVVRKLNLRQLTYVHRYTYTLWVVCPNFGHPAVTSCTKQKYLQVKNSFALIVNVLTVLKLFQLLNGD